MRATVPLALRRAHFYSWRVSVNFSGLDEVRLARLIEVGRSLVSELDLETVLERVLEEARQVTGARYAALGILDERRRELERFLTAGIDAEARTEIGELPRGRGILGELIRDPRPLRLSDVGEHPRSYGFPPGHPPMRTFLGVPILIRGDAFGNLYLTEKEGGGFDAADEQAVVVLAAWAAIAIENARLYREVDEHRKELERALSGLEATTAVARAVGGETDLERVLELIVKRGRALVDARSLVITLEEDDELVVGATAGEVDDALRGTRFPVEGSMAGYVMHSGGPQRMSDFAATVPSVFADLGLPAQSGLIVPLIFRGRPLGALGAFDRLEHGPEFDAEDERLLVAFAASAATAVATAKSVVEERLEQSIAAAEHERQRWARELHDETLQGLGALRLLLGSALKSPETDALIGAVGQAVDQIQAEIEKLRALIADLRPAALDEIGLAGAVESLVERIARDGLPIHAEVKLGARDRRLAPQLELTLYRVAQEALTNVAKHAQAELVSIRLIEQDGSIELTVKDDGNGFDAGESSAGFGLVGMGERVALAGGSLSLSSSPGGGTRISAVLPVSGGAANRRPGQSTA